MNVLLSIFVLYVLRVGNSATVCEPAHAAIVEAAWPYNADIGQANSCVSSAGATNDLGNAPTMCANDPTSVRLEMQEGQAECLVATLYDCKIPMWDFTSMDYDFAIDGCNGVWAAPLWMTPDTWQWGEGSGEIDSMEFCARDAIHLNYAGGGHQVGLDPAKFNIDDSEGHITVRKDPAGIVTIAACTAQEADSDPSGKRQCPAPVYYSCDECLDQSNSYACWCNDASGNIYGSGGCVEGTDCLWTLVSDIWNGVYGDGGYYGCMTAVPDISLDAGVPNYQSRCKISVEHIVLRGGGENEALQWGEGSPSYCNAFTPSSVRGTRTAAFVMLEATRTKAESKTTRPPVQGRAAKLSKPLFRLPEWGVNSTAALLFDLKD